MESHTPAAPSTDQTTATATTVTMPKAIESRNAVFITDQGSRCTRRSRARRVPLGRAAEAARLGDDVPEAVVEVEPVEVDPVDAARPAVAALRGRLAAAAPAPGREDPDDTAFPAAATAAPIRPISGRLPVSPFDS